VDESGIRIRKDADHYARLRINLVQLAPKRWTRPRAPSMSRRPSLSYDRLLIATAPGQP